MEDHKLERDQYTLGQESITILKDTTLCKYYETVGRTNKYLNDYNHRSSTKAISRHTR